MGQADNLAAAVSIDEDAAWQRLIRSISFEAALERSVISGEPGLAAGVLMAVAIIA